MAQPHKSNMVGMSAEGVRLVLQGSCGLTALDRRLKGLKRNEYTGGYREGYPKHPCALPQLAVLRRFSTVARALSTFALIDVPERAAGTGGEGCCRLI